MMGMVVRIPSCLYIEYLSSFLLLKALRHWLICVLSSLQIAQSATIAFHYNMDIPLSQVFLKSGCEKHFLCLTRWQIMVIILVDRVNNFMLVSVTQRADVSLPRIRPYWGCKFSLGDIHDVRMNYLYRDTGPPPLCGWQLEMPFSGGLT
jgi:hypothetical protein